MGKYEVPETLPDGLHVQKIMAGQADRGAAACVLECTTAGLHEGRYPPPSPPCPPGYLSHFPFQMMQDCGITAATAN